MSEDEPCQHKEWIRRSPVSGLGHVKCKECGIIVPYDEFIIWNGTNPEKMAKVYYVD